MNLNLNKHQDFDLFKILLYLDLERLYTSDSKHSSKFDFICILSLIVVLKNVCSKKKVLKNTKKVVVVVVVIIPVNHEIFTRIF